MKLPSLFNILLSSLIEINLSSFEYSVRGLLLSVDFQLYFRELPAPLLTYSLYTSFVQAVRAEAGRRHGLIRQTVRRLDQASYRWL